MILPSLLEYSVPSFEHKLSLLGGKEAKKITKYRGKIPVHLDMVLPQFAKDRSKMTSLGLCETLDSMKKFAFDDGCTLSIHLMGSTEDIYDAYKYFETYDFVPSWRYLLLVPAKYTNLWRALPSKKKNVTIGCWYDVYDWQHMSFEKRQTNLLMTVPAGSSGQKQSHEIREAAIAKAHAFPHAHFLLDGGWNIEASVPKNCDIVSYGDFWGKFSQK
jgi:hypothetical protein